MTDDKLLQIERLISQLALIIKGIREEKEVTGQSPGITANNELRKVIVGWLITSDYKFKLATIPGCDDKRTQIATAEILRSLGFECKLTTYNSSTGRWWYHPKRSQPLSLDLLTLCNICRGFGLYIPPPGEGAATRCYGCNGRGGTLRGPSEPQD